MKHSTLLKAVFRLLAGAAPLTLAAFWTLQGPASYGQKPPVIQVNVTLVRVPFVATQNGSPVRDLRREELSVLDDGIAQDVKYLWQDTDLPLSIGLLFDVSIREGNLVHKYQKSIPAFLSHLLGPRDRVFIATADDQPRLLLDWTSSSAEVLLTAEKLQRESRDGTPFGEACVPPPASMGFDFGNQCAGTPIWDAVFHLARSKFVGLPGRKALLVFSPGYDLQSSEHGLSSALEAVEGSGVVVYTVQQYKGCLPSQLVPPRLVRAVGDNGMKDIVDITGGREFRSPWKLDRVYAKIAADLRNQYVLAYTPKAPVGPAEWHRLEVSISRAHTKVRAPARYLGPQG